MSEMREKFSQWLGANSQHVDSVTEQFMFEAWQAATEAAKATGTAGEIDADAEMAKVKRDVELMGVGFLVDGKRCSLDRITWFNRPGDTWLPPPPGYPTEAARQPAPALPVKQWHERLGVDPREFGDDTPEELAMLAEIADLRAALLQTQENSDDISAHLKAKNEMVSTLRAALAATAAPVLSDEKLHKIWLNICMDEDKSVPRFIRFYRSIIAATRSQP